MADYGEEKSKNFAKYCKEGKIKLVQKWFSNPNINVNWNFDSPLRRAIAANQVEVVKLLLTHPNLKTDWQNRKEIKGARVDDAGKGVSMMFNPFTEAIYQKSYEIMDLLINVGKVLVERTEHLDILLQMEDDELTEYFTKRPGFIDYVLSQDTKYTAVVSKDAADIFMF